MPHNMLYKKIFVHNPFYKFMRRRMAQGTLPPVNPVLLVCMFPNAILIPLCVFLSLPSLQLN